jgi:hypothetical protein
VKMTRRGAGGWARLTLLCALAFGVVATHHVGMAEADRSMTGQPMQQGVAAPAERGQHGAGMNQDMVDLWLAVMCAAVVLVVTAWGLRAVRSVAFPLGARVGG